jgi:hypothetical protein
MKYCNYKIKPPLDDNFILAIGSFIMIMGLYVAIGWLRFYIKEWRNHKTVNSQYERETSERIKHRDYKTR